MAPPVPELRQKTEPGRSAQSLLVQALRVLQAKLPVLVVVAVVVVPALAGVVPEAEALPALET